MSRMRKFIVPTKMSALPVASPTPATFSLDAMLQQKQPQHPPAADSAEPIATALVDTPPTTPAPSTAKESSTAVGRVLPTSSADSTPASSTTTGLVKMCGYLKKKRNKMGGWRKLFFILQNQLLLSYSSREDYEKKLAPFKDIINLVPGTIIIPTTGPRFTIETNSKIMYTFRCDDHRSCSEWIMALLDSLTVANGGHGLMGAADRNRSLHNTGFHRSTLPLASFSSPSRCEPFGGAVGRAKEEVQQQQQQQQKRTGPVKPPRNFPVAAGGAARTGRQQRQRSAGRESATDTDDHNNNVQPLHSNVKSGTILASQSLSNPRDDDDPAAGAVEERSPPPETAAAAAAAERDRQRQIFRLHQDVWRTSAHQSVDVCRINSMFSSSAGSVQPDRLAEDGCGSATASELPSGDGHVYEDVRAPGSEPTDTCSELGPEPIYAVVDVRAKRSRRLARLLEPDGEPAGTGRKVSVSLPQISDGAELTCVVAGAAAGQRRAGAARSCSNYDDYEDVNFLVAAVHRASEDAHSVGSQELFGEHIYEPIRVAETRLPSVTMAGSSSSLPARAEHTGSGLWRQLKRLHLDGSWRRLTLRTRDTRPAAAAATGTVLEGLGRRLDSHRRSIKQRLKSLRDRIDPTAPPPPDGPPACPSNTSTGSRSRKSRSLDSFLRTEGPDGATEPAVLSV